MSNFVNRFFIYVRCSEFPSCCILTLHATVIIEVLEYCCISHPFQIFLNWLELFRFFFLHYFFNCELRYFFPCSGYIWNLYISNSKSLNVERSEQSAGCAFRADGWFPSALGRWHSALCSTGAKWSLWSAAGWCCSPARLQEPCCVTLLSSDKATLLQCNDTFW